jgi:hypothetical protein
MLYRFYFYDMTNSDPNPVCETMSRDVAITMFYDECPDCVIRNMDEE